MRAAVHDRRAPRGFSLAEVMLSLAVVAMIGAAVAAMLGGVATGTARQSDARRLETRERVIAGRLDASLRSAHRVLGRDADVLVLWMGDARANGQPDLSELRRIEWDRATGELWSYRAPATLDEARDPTFRLTDDFTRITARLRNTPWFVGRRWGRGVAGFATSLEGRPAQDATVVRYRLEVERNGVRTDVERSVALRGRGS